MDKSANDDSNTAIGRCVLFGNRGLIAIMMMLPAVMSLGTSAVRIRYFFIGRIENRTAGNRYITGFRMFLMFVVSALSFRVGLFRKLYGITIDGFTVAQAGKTRFYLFLNSSNIFYLRCYQELPSISLSTGIQIVFVKIHEIPYRYELLHGLLFFKS